jgi:hypothetical protein
MKELDLPGVDFDLNGETLMLKGDVSPEVLEKVKKAIDGLGFGCDQKSA